MKQNAAILALLVGAVAAQNRADKDAPGPIYKADKTVVQCEIAGDDAVSTAAADKKTSTDEVEKLKGKLNEAIAKVAEERTARDEAVKAVIAKDELFKVALKEADDAENTAMALYKTANDSQKLYDDAKLKSDGLQAAHDAMEAKYDALKADKEAAEKAVTDQSDHHDQEEATELSTRNAYGGVLGGSNSDGGGDCTEVSSKCKATTTAKAAYESAQGVLATPKNDYDVKAAAVVAAKAEWDAAKAISDIAETVKTTQAAVIGATDTTDPSKKKSKKDADDALSTYGSSGDLSTKQTAFNSAADAAGEAWKTILDNETNKDYLGAAGDAKDCTQGADTAYFAVVDDTTYDKAACIDKCQEKSYFDSASTKNIVDDAAYCYGIEITSDDKCRMWKKAIPIPLGDASARSAKGCYTRTASVNAFAFFQTNTLHTDLATAVTGYATDITAAWDVLIDAAENGRRDLDLEEKIQTYITATYLDLDPTGLSFITGAKKDTYDALVIEETNLKNAADAKGMDTSVALSDYSNKSMATLKSEWDTAADEQATAYTTWQAAKTELDRQAASNAINEAWKSAATTAFNAVDGDFKGTDKVEDVYDKAVADTETKRLKWVADEALYTAHIADAAYTTPAAKAKLDDATSDVAEQKAVFDERDKANIAQGKVNDAIADEKLARGNLAAEVANCATKELALQTALAACETAQYAKFRKTFQDATETRTGNLGKIKALMEKRETAAAASKPGSGKAGARCERPRSNGDQKTRTLCEAELCCGSASKLIGQTEVTIETCQKADATKYAYQPPRSAMGLAMPATEDWDFACIAGAQRVLAAAAAAAAAGLMMQ